MPGVQKANERLAEVHLERRAQEGGWYATLSDPDSIHHSPGSHGLLLERLAGGRRSPGQPVLTGVYIIQLTALHTCWNSIPFPPLRSRESSIMAVNEKNDPISSLTFSFQKNLQLIIFYY